MVASSFHTRSISLPKISPTCAVEEHLCRLRSSELATSSSSSSISHNLAGLQELYACVEVFLLSSHAQKSISSGDRKCLDQLLDGSLNALDVCGSVTGILSQMKANVQDLQSCIRRKGAESSVANEIRSYLNSRKKENKLFQKCLGGMKKMENKFVSQENDVVSALQEVASITLAVFESLLSYVSGSNTKSKQSKWSLISKLTHDRPTLNSEVVKADVALNNVISRKTCKSIHAEDIQEPLEALEHSIQGLEARLECLFRHLIKTRVSLLNMLNQY